MHDSVRRIHDAAPILRAAHAPSDAAGRLADDAAEVLRASGGVRLLQSKQHGGEEAHPTEFCEWVRAVASYNPSAGWMAGVLGVHPWELALAETKLQDEIYATGPDTWVASPYMPGGRAKPEGDGFRFSGRWQYSTGTDHCDWIILGGIVTDAAGEISFPPDIRHFILPRKDYEIIEDSWHVMGLSGTGSKDIVIDGAFVPEYRTIGHTQILHGEYAGRQPGNPLYSMSFACVFAAAISSATLGIATGLLREYRTYLETRISAALVIGKTDPFQQAALAEAEADLAAAIVHIDSMLTAMYDRCAETGEVPTQAERLEFRRNQARAVQRVLESVNNVMNRAGSAATWTTWPIERFWRDLRTGGSHLCNAVDTVYTSWANCEFATGGPVTTFH